MPLHVITSQNHKNQQKTRNNPDFTYIVQVLYTTSPFEDNPTKFELLKNVFCLDYHFVGLIKAFQRKPQPHSTIENKENINYQKKVGKLSAHLHEQDLEQFEDFSRKNFEREKYLIRMCQVFLKHHSIVALG